MTDKSGIRKACDAMGSEAALGVALDRTQQAVSWWVQRGYAPAHLVPKIAELTGVPTRELLDPELVHLAEG